MNPISDLLDRILNTAEEENADRRKLMEPYVDLLKSKSVDQQPGARAVAFRCLGRLTRELLVTSVIRPLTAYVSSMRITKAEGLARSASGLKLAETGLWLIPTIGWLEMDGYGVLPRPSTRESPVTIERLQEITPMLGSPEVESRLAYRISRLRCPDKDASVNAQKTQQVMKEATCIALKLVRSFCNTGQPALRIESAFLHATVYLEGIGMVARLLPN